MKASLQWGRVKGIHHISNSRAYLFAPNKTYMFSVPNLSEKHIYIKNIRRMYRCKNTFFFYIKNELLQYPFFKFLLFYEERKQCTWTTTKANSINFPLTYVVLSFEYSFHVIKESKPTQQPVMDAAVPIPALCLPTSGTTTQTHLDSLRFLPVHTRANMHKH